VRTNLKQKNRGGLVGEKMPVEKEQMSYERLPAISLKSWKNKEIKAFQFLDEGTDIQNTPYGLIYLYRARVPYYFISVVALNDFNGLNTFAENSRFRYCRLIGGC
jgi:hypothetical protein